MAAHSENLLEALVATSERVGLRLVTFTEVLSRADVSRATAYRLFPDGIDGLLGAMEDQLADQTFLGIGKEVLSTRKGLVFSDVVEMAVRNYVVAARESQLFRVFGGDAEAINRHLLSFSNSPIGALRNFISQSSYMFGAFGGETHETRTAVDRLVWAVMTELASDLIFGNQAWPDHARLKNMIEFLLSRYSDAESPTVLNPQALVPLISWSQTHEAP